MDNQEILNKLRTMHGDRVMCTDGLFHIINDDNSEVYINKHDGEIDRRGKYKTVRVFSSVVLAEVLNDSREKFVVLSKHNLECFYRTQGKIVCVDQNLMYDTNGVVISKRGRILGKFNNIRDITSIANKYYLINCDNMYSDKVVSYLKHGDFIQDLTRNKNYIINGTKEDKNTLDVVDMNGGRFLYNFANHACKNMFTMNDEDIIIWTLR